MRNIFLFWYLFYVWKEYPRKIDLCCMNSFHSCELNCTFLFNNNKKENIIVWKYIYIYIHWIARCIHRKCIKLEFCLNMDIFSRYVSFLCIGVFNGYCFHSSDNVKLSFVYMWCQNGNVFILHMRVCVLFVNAHYTHSTK